MATEKKLQDMTEELEISFDVPLLFQNARDNHPFHLLNSLQESGKVKLGNPSSILNVRGTKDAFQRNVKPLVYEINQRLVSYRNLASPSEKRACNTLMRNADRIASEIVKLYESTGDYANLDDNLRTAKYTALLKQLEIDAYNRTATRYQIAATLLTILTSMLVAAIIATIVLMTVQMPASLPLAVKAAELVTLTANNLIASFPIEWIAAGALAGAAVLITGASLSGKFFYEGYQNRQFAQNRMDQSKLTSEDQKHITAYRKQLS